MCLAGMLIGVSQRNTVLNRNRRLLLWWSQQKKDDNDVNLQFDNGQSGHAPPRGWHGRIGSLWIRHWACVVQQALSIAL